MGQDDERRRLAAALDAAREGLLVALGALEESRTCLDELNSDGPGPMRGPYQSSHDVAVEAVGIITKSHMLGPPGSRPSQRARENDQWLFERTGRIAWRIAGAMLVAAVGTGGWLLRDCKAHSDLAAPQVQGK
jgi:hypothetical protein